MAYTQAIEGKKGIRHRGFYQDTAGRYKSAGTYDTAERALEVAEAAEKHAAELVRGAAGQLNPVIRATRTIAEYEPIFLRHHRVEGNTKDTYADTLRLHVMPFIGNVRVAEMTRRAARNFFTTLEEAGRSPNTIRQAKVVLAAMFTLRPAHHHAVRQSPSEPGSPPELHPRRLYGLRHLTSPASPTVRAVGDALHCR